MKRFFRQPSRSSRAPRHDARRPARGYRRALICAIAVKALGTLAAPAIPASPVAVVVNSDVRIDDLSFPELRKILLGDRKFWSTGRPIRLIVRTAESAERTVMLDRVYRMNEAQFRQHWIAKVFRAEASSEPMEAKSNDEAVELAGVLEGAITLVDSADVPAGLKVVRIDGLLPGDPGYRLEHP